MLARLVLAVSCCAAQIPDVSLDVVVRDKKGRVVSNLAAADLEVTDGGTPVAVKKLQLVRPGEGGGGSQAISLIFDHIVPERGRLARQGAEELLKQAAPGTWFAVFNAGRGLSVLQNYTQDREAVRRAVQQLTTRQSRGVHGDAPPGTRNALAENRDGRPSVGPGDSVASTSLADRLSRESLQSRLERISTQSSLGAEELLAEENSRSSLLGLLALARAHGEAQGRKALVLFSQGIQMTTRMRTLLRETVSAANRANTSIYVFDTSELSVEARRSAVDLYRDPVGAVQIAPSSPSTTRPATNVTGLRGMTMSGPQSVRRGDDFLQQTSNYQQSLLHEDQSAVMELAQGTGGFYAGDVNDLRKPVRKLIEELETRYTVSFASADAEMDGKFREVAVKVKEPGLRVQSQAGYVALPPGAGADTRPFEIPLLKALAATAPAREIAFRSRALDMGSQTAVVVQIPLEQMQALEDASSQMLNMHLAVLARIRNAQGEKVQQFSQDLPYRIASERRDQLSSAAFTFERHFAAPPGQYALECVVLDVNGKKAGVERSEFQVAAGDGGPRVSAITLVRGFEPLAAEQREKELFRYEGSKVVPALEDSFSAKEGAPLRFFFLVQAGGPPEVEVEIQRDGEPYAKTSLRPRGDGGLVFSLPAESLATGQYKIRVEARQGGKAGEQSASIRVEGGEAKAEVKSTLTSLQPVAAAQHQPGDAEQQRIVKALQQRVGEHAEKLPNFSCLLVTRRWVDPSGQEQWRARGSYVELVRVIDNDERHELLEVDGKKASKDPVGMRSAGEFGAHLRMALDPKYQAEIRWKEWTMLGNKLVHVFSYRVEEKHSQLRLLGAANAPGMQNPAYHGLLYVEPETLAIRRLSLEAENPAASSGYQEMSMVVDYDYVAVGDRDQVMPVQAEVRAKLGRQARFMNQIEFRDYKRFGAESSIRFEENK